MQIYLPKFEAEFKNVMKTPAFLTSHYLKKKEEVPMNNKFPIKISIVQDRNISQKKVSYEKVS